ncbi:MAG: UDP-glucose/GDP-mannose dehydrogenase family protein, partial [Pseudomonadota bacterium]|nr:UDP-glucose/GDP-mannose dehydrogenase family protein [Pseudomonadota bacterium]
ASRVKAVVQEELKNRGLKISFSVASNPEFLKEGAAIEDFMRPDRIIIGADDDAAIQRLRALYAPFQRNHERVLVMDISSAELTKYAANAMLATRISFMNELAQLAEKLGADIEHVRQGVGSDIRIGYHFLYAGCGYGGSCFPKDVQALQRRALDEGVKLRIIDAVQQVNEEQKHVLVDKVLQRFGQDLKGLRFALWGLAFKPNTDDMREAPSRTVITRLLKHGATICAYDPAAMQEARRVFKDNQGLTYSVSAMDALESADALIIVTEWKSFQSPDFFLIASKLRQPVIFDGRNLYEPQEMLRAGFEYHAIGRRMP